MVKFETANELALKVTMGAGDIIYTKAGAFVSGLSLNGKKYQFEKVLLGPQGNAAQALLGQLLRRVTGENLPLMKVTAQDECVTFYANKAQHVVCFQLAPGETISVESENILAFTSDCKYSVRFLAQGVISQKGLATSTLTGQGSNSYVAILCDGNPLVHSNEQNGATIEVDPDAVICWIGADPGFKLDISWKNIIGQASGETYMFEWGGNARAKVLLQPNERDGSGLNIGMDGGSSGSRPDRQNNPTLSDAANTAGNALQQAGNLLTSNPSSGQNSASSVVSSLLRSLTN